jgi:hypothetical protein
MTFATEIQSLVGAHTSTLASNDQCAVDWARDRVFIAGQILSGLGPYISRVGLLTGLEEAWSLSSTYTSGAVPPIGIDANGDFYLGKGGLYGGGIAKGNGNTLALVGSGTYSTGYFGNSSFANVTVGSSQFILDTNNNGSIVGELIVTLNMSEQLAALWPIGAGSGLVCAGKSGSHKGYLVNTPSAGASLTISVINCSVIGMTTLGTIDPTDIDAGWTTIGCKGVCCDLTDGNLLLMVYGQSGASQRNYLIKVDTTDASVTWTSAVPDSGGTENRAGGGKMMAQSRIQHQKFCILTASHFGSPPVTLTEIDTSDGSSTSFTTGLAGLAGIGFQAFDDTIGGIVCNVTYTEGADSPTSIGSTPSSFSGWAVLYVTEEFAPPSPPEPVPGSDIVTPYVPPIIIPPVRQLRLFPRLPINSYSVTDARTDFPVTFRVSAQADLRVSVDGVELTQSDFTFTGKASAGSWYEGGLLTLDTEVEDCTVRVWADPIPSRTTDYAAGEFVKAEANASLEKLWITDRAQHLKQTRDVEIPLTGTVTLAAATGGLRYRLQGPVTATGAGSDQIYIAGSHGTVLTGADENAFCEIVCTKAGLWFVRTKTGTWSVA